MGLSGLARVADVVVVMLLCVSAEIQVWAGDASTRPGGLAVHFALAAIITLPLLVRRRYPLAVFCAVIGASVLQYQLGVGLGQPWLAMLLALYATAAHAPRQPALMAGALAAFLMLSDGVPKLLEGEPWDNVIPAWFFVAGVWGFGRWMRSRRGEIAQLHEQAVELERDREDAARAAVGAERARIARELHDLVAHSMGVIVIQSQAAQRVLRTNPSAAERALVSIETTGRQGLSELRRLLDILIGADDTAPLAPQPALSHLDTLLDQVRAAGLPVEVSVEGGQRALPPGLDVSAYRIVQEALTNTLRHAGPAHAQVRLRYRNDAVDVEVSDDGKAVGVDNIGGHGLIGMRERVAIYGGTLSSGHQPEGGYLVRAHLPFNAADTRGT